MSEHKHKDDFNCENGSCEIILEKKIRTIKGHRFHINGLDCASCALKIEKKLIEKDYVKDVVLNFPANLLTVDSDLEISILQSKVQNVINSIESGVIISTEKIQTKVKLFDIKEHWFLVIGVLLYVVALYFNSPIVFILAYLIIGKDVLINSFKNIRSGNYFDENFLMTIATLGAIAIKEYPEAIGVMLFYNIGEIFQDYAVNNTRASINSLMDLKEDFANVLKDGQVYSTKVENVKIGDIIVIKVGEKIPLDGIVVNGITEIDTASITGESNPIVKDVGEEILSGSINLTNLIQVKATKLYEDSTVARIIDLLENSANTAAKSEKFITRFAKVYTPIVVSLAIIVGIIIPLLFNLDFNVWLYRALVFLVVSCPCALVISVPLALYAGIGKASSIGALIKGGNFLEMLKDVDTIVFDKTNTITKGEFEVINVEGEILELIAYSEFYSNHPIAKSIVNYYGKNIDISRISNFNEVIGKGINVYIDQKLINVGNYEYLKDLNIEVKQISSINTIIYVVVENKYFGYLEIGDVIKSNAKDVISILNENYSTIMLTGDKKSVAIDIAKKTGIKKVYSDLLPIDKVDKVSELVNSKNKIMFVGDGINDGPVLVKSDIGIAMGAKGSELAKDVADIVLMNDNLSSIVKILKISNFTHKIVVENIVFALGIKVIVLILATFGIANMWLGVFADVGVTLLAVLNSLRILRINV